MKVIDSLQDFYRENGIFAENFQCVSESRCRYAAENNGGTFTTAREPIIGQRYLDSWPKIVVVSLDPGSQYDKNEDRFLEPHELKLQTVDHAVKHLGPMNRHWYRTHEGVAAIVRKTKSMDITPNEAALWFAHTSVVRCCANLPHSKQAPPAMFWNCRRFLQGEIAIFKPDIVWTQGDRAYEAMSWVAGNIAKDATPTANFFKIIFDWGSFSWVHTDHPFAARGSKARWGKALDILKSLKIGK